MKERVQLNLSVTLEQKLALQALAEGHGTSVTKLVLGLIEQGSSPSVVVKSAEEWREAAEDEAVVQIEAAVGPSPRVIESPADVPAAVGRAARSMNPAPRPFTPYSKATQVVRPRKAKAEPMPTCRHGLLRCKVCGSG